MEFKLNKIDEVKGRLVFSGLLDQKEFCGSMLISKVVEYAICVDEYNEDDCKFIAEKIKKIVGMYLRPGTRRGGRGI